MYLPRPLQHYYPTQYPTLPEIPQREQPKLIYDSRYEVEDKYYRNQIQNQEDFAQSQQEYQKWRKLIKIQWILIKSCFFELNIQQQTKQQLAIITSYLRKIQSNNRFRYQVRLIYILRGNTIQKRICTDQQKLKQHNPNLLSLFYIFTSDNHYKIEKFKFLEVLQSYQDDVKVCDLELLFNYLNNWKRSQSITYGQFLQLIVPYVKYEQMPDPADLKYQQDQPTQEQMEIFCRLIKMKLQMMSTLEYYRQKIDKSLINLVQIFEFIDQDKDGLIKAFEITKLLQQFGYLVTVEEAQLVLQDIDERGQININQFVHYYKPKSQAIYL